MRSNSSSDSSKLRLSSRDSSIALFASPRFFHPTNDLSLMESRHNALTWLNLLGAMQHGSLIFLACQAVTASQNIKRTEILQPRRLGLELLAQLLDAPL